MADQLVIISIIITMVTTSLQVNADMCDTGWFYNNRMCFFLYKSKESHQQAIQSCQELGGTLTDTTSTEIIRQFNLGTVRLWSEYRMFKIGPGSNTVAILDKTNTTHVTNCNRCNQLKPSFLQISVTSSCIALENITDNDADWMLTSCDEANYFICEKFSDNIVLQPQRLTATESKDYAAIACASFLLISFILVIIFGTLCRRDKYKHDPNDSQQSTEPNSPDV